MFLGRQPILDAAQTVIGYELQFHAAAVPEVAETAETPAPASVSAQAICASFNELGIAEALRELKAFVHVDADFFGSAAIELLPAKQVVLDINATTAESALERCRKLSGGGYQFSVTVDPNDPLAAGALLDLARYVRINIADLPHELIAAAAAQLQQHAPKLLALSVDTTEQYEWCARHGFGFFQGYYFARPLLEEGRNLDPTAQALVRLINLVSGDVDTREIEAAFKTDPALTMNLLRVVNSAAMGLRTPLGSIAQAVTVLGRRQLLRWLQLLLFRGSGGTLANNPLMLHAAMRGRMMELLVERCRPTDHAALDSAFMVGVMSLMPAALRMTMGDVLAQISLAPLVHDAVADYEGTLGQLLLLIEYYDDSNELGCALTMQRLGDIDQHMINNCVVQTLLWVQGLDA